VIRIDLLGHGGSEKPRDGYSMENQADVVAQAMSELGIERAAIVGHSMGGVVATAFAERHRRMVSRVMLIGTETDASDLGLQPATVAFLPVTGHATDTLIGDRIVRLAVEDGFAPEFDPPRHLEKDIFGRTTWSSFSKSFDALDDYWDARPVHQRLVSAGVPATALLGEKEHHTPRSVSLYNEVGLRTVVMKGLDHSPQVESPERTAPLIATFVREP
jgi:2-succinyl-6-hydroxy-2,4-cyclohexadiene-1-carboxylate synthase